jgi:Hypothetical protein (DUF2513)
MKRDLDLERAILLYVEEHALPQGGLQNKVKIAGYNQPTIFAHIELLAEKGYLLRLA